MASYYDYLYQQMQGNTTTRPTTSLINQTYDSTIAAGQAARQAALDAQLGTIRQNISNVDQTYQPLMNNAYVSNAQQERARLEGMANIGMSGYGGTSQTLAQRNRTQLLNTLGQIGMQRQNYLNDQNTSLTNTQAQGAADINAYVSEQNAARNAALVADQQAANEERMAIFDRAVQAYQSGILSKDQFKTLTGIDPLSIRRGGGGGGGGPTWEDLLNSLLSSGSPTAQTVGSGTSSAVKIGNRVVGPY